MIDIETTEQIEQMTADEREEFIRKCDRYYLLRQYAAQLNHASELVSLRKFKMAREAFRIGDAIRDRLEQV